MSAGPPKYQEAGGPGYTSYPSAPPSAPPAYAPEYTPGAGGYQYGPPVTGQYQPVPYGYNAGVQQAGGQYPPPINAPVYPTSGPAYSAPEPHHVQEECGADEQLNNWAGNSFSDKKIRQAFIKKVYLILMLQLSVTVAFIAVFLFSGNVRYWVQRHQWFYWCSYVVFLITYITLICCDSVRRKWPVNFICLSVFTLALSYMTGTISSYYGTEIVLITVAITAAVCLAISLFAIQTKIDFTLCSGLLFASVMVLILFGFSCMIVGLVSGPSKILHCVYSALAALVFSLFLVFDTQMIVGGKNRRYQLSAEEYIYGALQLYVDVVNLFLNLLNLVGLAR